MPGDDRQFQPKRSSGKVRREDPPYAVPEQRRRDLPMTEDDIFAEDETLASKPPRPSSSAIRLNPTASQRAITTQSARQIVPAPIRRSGHQPVTTASNAIPARTARNITTQQSPVYTAPLPKERRRVHWLLPVGIGMLAMLALWASATSVVGWAKVKYDDVRYGNPRTYQADAVVGHGGDSSLHPSHFVAINLNRHIVVVEFMAGDPAKAITYGGPYLYGSGEDLTPPILEFRDVTGDGRLDMIIHIGDQSIVFVNAGDKFRPSNSNDNIHL